MGQLNKLSARTVASAKAGRHADGGGLYLTVEPGGAKRWAFMFWRDRKPTEIGLGSIAKGVDLAMARERARECRRLMASGKNPREWNGVAKRIPTFTEMAAMVIASLEQGWRNDKHRAQWHSSITTYCGPIAHKPVNEITVEHVLAVLQPIWTAKSETASRLRGRIEKILDAARARGYRESENPARWRGNLDHLLSRRQKLQRGHHPSMPWAEVPAFVARLRATNAVASRCLEFIILTGARVSEVTKSTRAGEVHGLRWEGEIDRQAMIWTCPGIRMKGGKDHRKPLTPRVAAILDEMAVLRSGDYVFPAQTGRGPLTGMACEMLLRRLGAKPATIHGFRASFRTWATECANVPRELVEMCIDHLVGSAVERAYQRGDALERRREIMLTWERFLSGEQVGGAIPLTRPST